MASTGGSLVCSFSLSVAADPEAVEAVEASSDSDIVRFVEIEV